MVVVGESPQAEEVLRAPARKPGAQGGAGGSLTAFPILFGMVEAGLPALLSQGIHVPISLQAGQGFLSKGALRLGRPSKTLTDERP